MNVSDDLPDFLIQPTSGWRLLDLRELWAYRELIYFLTLRDIKVRYKQTAIGVAWALLQPLAMLVVFTLFFGKLAGVSSQEAAYPLFVLSALTPWQLFSRAITESTNSLVTDTPPIRCLREMRSRDRVAIVCSFARAGLPGRRSSE